MRKLVEDQKARFKLKLIKRKGSQARREQILLDEKFPEEVRTNLIEIFHEPLKGEVLACNRGTRIRNVTMLRILYEIGMRRGELLSLKLKHFIEASGGDSAYLVIERNHHDEYDSRTNQPVVKTAGRTVPISEELELQILSYRTDQRAELVNVGFSDNDFLFVVHRSGKTQGHGLTLNGFNSVFTYLKKTFPLLGKKIHAHAFRHDWNDRFSLYADEKGLSEQEESERRAELMGWALGSNMVKIYNRRHIRNKAMEAGRAVARDTERPKK
ncbi:site-specific integrase [Pseudomonas brassicacearum]|uniref:site-specific integrase n=1 Tax=Pseudomonas brassicacearum TaxID=930166 RepID=UPI0021822929|nr:site-specific integrase [Pseudomonas brassicacearum]